MYYNPLLTGLALAAVTWGANLGLLHSRGSSAKHHRSTRHANLRVRREGSHREGDRARWDVHRVRLRCERQSHRAFYTERHHALSVRCEQSTGEGDRGEWAGDGLYL